MAVVLGRTGSLSGQPSKQQPRSTLLDSDTRGVGYLWEVGDSDTLPLPLLKLDGAVCNWRL
ncbi:hypothetical protein J6590_077933 [Homalodisca vitripennis]|nr:hypothetical protein J6590_077933 [Homalodisca vitripennis]